MANLFGNRSVRTETLHTRLLRRYVTAQFNLFLVALCTAINIFLSSLLLLDTYFLFSAFVPYDIATTAAVFCGKLSPEFYEELGMQGMTFLPEGFFFGSIILALAIAGLYAIFAILSKKKVGWMVAALVIYSIDTMMLFFSYGVDISLILDYAFHIWVIVSLSMGIAAAGRIKKLPEEDPESVSSVESSEQETEEEERLMAVARTSPAFRAVDWNQKGKIRVQAEAIGHKIYFRRVKRINELIVDDQVYADIELLIEPAHSVEAMIDGHDVQAGYDGAITCYIKIDGKIVAKKRQLI